MGGGGGSGGFGSGIVSDLFHGGKSVKKRLTPEVPKIRPVEEPNIDAEAAEAAERERLRLSRKRGRASTILTGPLGDLNPAQLGRKVLTGG